MSSSLSGPKRGRPSRGAVEGKEGTQSILRATRLLFSLADGRTGLGHRASRLADRLQLPQPTVHRILKALASQGLVTQDQETARWRLGRGAYELGLAATPDQRLVAAAEPVLARLRDATGETSLLAVRSGLDGVCLSLSWASPPSRDQVVHVGTRRPLGVGATGLAMLAALDESDAHASILQNASRYAIYDGIEPDRIFYLVQETRRQGYSRTLGDFYPDVASVGMAWRLSRRAVVSISVASAPKRMSNTQASFAAKVLRAEVAQFSQAFKADVLLG